MDCITIVNLIGFEYQTKRAKKAIKSWDQLQPLSPRPCTIATQAVCFRKLKMQLPGSCLSIANLTWLKNNNNRNRKKRKLNCNSLQRKKQNKKTRTFPRHSHLQFSTMPYVKLILPLFCNNIAALCCQLTNMHYVIVNLFFFSLFFLKRNKYVKTIKFSAFNHSNHTKPKGNIIKNIYKY